MKKSIWLYLFFAALILELAAVALSWELAQYIAKPLLMTFLGAYFIQQSRGSIAARQLVLLAIFFSWLGDVFLLMQEDNSRYFMAGLVCFLIAHFFYIFFFLRVRSIETVAEPWRLLRIIVVAVYVAVLFIYLYSSLGELRLPVLAYALALGTMLVCCWHAFTAGSSWFWFCLAGAVLFVISDSLLAINKFKSPFPASGFWIILTYALAQFAIVYGSLQWLALQRQHSHQKLVM